MKNIVKTTLTIAAAFALAACGKEAGPSETEVTTGSIIGEWHMEQWGGSGGSLQAADIYIRFGDDGSFDLYQRFDKPTYTHYEGTYRISGTTLSGTYADGTKWSNASYAVSFSDNGSNMRLTGSTEDDVALYVKTAIPPHILSGELATKAGGEVSVAADGPRFL